MPGKITLSYAFKGSEKPLIGKTIGDMFDEVAETYPDNDALVSLHQGVRYTYRELQKEVNRTAKGLLSLGLKKGRPGGHLGDEHRRMGHGAGSDVQGGHHHDQHQPRLQDP